VTSPAEEKINPRAAIKLLPWKAAIWASAKDVFALIGFYWFTGYGARLAFGDVPILVLTAGQLIVLALAQRLLTGRWYPLIEILINSRATGTKGQPDD
jgi:hypothetical protein